MPIISPSLLSSDFANLQSEVELLNKSEADWYHIDVMDGVFVPNISYGLPVLKAINKYATKPLDVHLMIVKPENYLQQFKEAGAEIITVHIEACPHIHRTIQEIKNLGCKAGVAINPGTPINVLDSILQDLDVVLVMSVNPGFGGQTFIKNSVDKVYHLKQKITQSGLSTILEVDGGVNQETAKFLVEAGADALVAGSYIFGSKNPSETILELKKIS